MKLLNIMGWIQHALSLSLTKFSSFLQTQLIHADPTIPSIPFLVVSRDYPPIFTSRKITDPVICLQHRQALSSSSPTRAGTVQKGAKRLSIPIHKTGILAGQVPMGHGHRADTPQKRGL